jgi:hypothetical protein
MALFKRVPYTVKVSWIKNDALRRLVIVVLFPFMAAYCIGCAVLMLCVFVLLGVFLLIVGLFDVLGITHLVRTAKEMW